MRIQEFQLKFTSAAEQGNLFQALRNLSEVEDAQALLGDDRDLVEWVLWPPEAS